MFFNTYTMKFGPKTAYAVSEAHAYWPSSESAKIPLPTSCLLGRSIPFLQKGPSQIINAPRIISTLEYWGWDWRNRRDFCEIILEAFGTEAVVLRRPVKATAAIAEAGVAISSRSIHEFFLVVGTWLLRLLVLLLTFTVWWFVGACDLYRSIYREKGWGYGYLPSGIRKGRWGINPFSNRKLPYPLNHLMKFYY